MKRHIFAVLALSGIAAAQKYDVEGDEEADEYEYEERDTTQGYRPVNIDDEGFQDGPIVREDASTSAEQKTTHLDVDDEDGLDEDYHADRKYESEDYTNGYHLDPAYAHSTYEEQYVEEDEDEEEPATKETMTNPAEKESAAAAENHDVDKYLEDEDWFDGTNVEEYEEYAGVVPDYKKGRYEGHLGGYENQAKEHAVETAASKAATSNREELDDGDKGRYEGDEHDWATDYSAYSGSRDSGTVVGFDKQTGETVEFETYDPVIFDEVLEHIEKESGAAPSETYFAGIEDRRQVVEGVSEQAKEEVDEVVVSAAADAASETKEQQRHFNAAYTIGNANVKKHFEEAHNPAPAAHEETKAEAQAEKAAEVAPLGGMQVLEPDDCDECQVKEQEDADMSLAMTGFALFGIILFMMWYMLRSCKQKSDENQFDPSNPQSRGRYRPASLSPYQADDDSEAVPQVQLAGIEQNY